MEKKDSAIISDFSKIMLFILNKKRYTEMELFLYCSAILTYGTLFVNSGILMVSNVTPDISATSAV